MRFTFAGALLALASTQAFAASQWGFADGTLSVSAKGAGVGGGSKQKFAMDKKLPQAVKLGSTDTLKILFTAQEGKNAKKPHQAFLTLEDANGLETSFPFSVKDSGKAKVDVTFKDIPPQLLQSTAPLSASIVIGSFGDSKAYRSVAFELSLSHGDGPAPSAPASGTSKFGKQPEIHHVFRANPRSPPKIITLVFTLAVLAALPVTIGVWLALGGNFNHLGKAVGGSPIGHALYFGGIVAMQLLFVAYYWSYNLFQILIPALAISTVILFAGSKALTEVQERRLAAQR